MCEKKKKRGHLEWWHLFSQVTIIYDGALLFWRLSNIYLPMGSSECILCRALVVWAAFDLYWLNCFISTHKASSFCPPDPPLHPSHGEWVISCVEFSCWPGWNHIRVLVHTVIGNRGSLIYTQKWHFRIAQADEFYVVQCFIIFHRYETWNVEEKN